MYAVESVLSEPRFKFETQAAKTAYRLASVFVQSKDVHQHRIIRFANILEEKLKTCFITTHRTQKLKQEKMWGQYHQLRTSKQFILDWKLLLSEITEIEPCAAFIQYVTHEVFKQMMKVQFPPTTPTSKTLPLLTDIEVNALRYVAGYVCRTLHDRLKTSSVEGKEVLVLYLSDMNGSDKNGDGEEWINAINRGSLWQVNEEVFQTFLIIEELVRDELCLEKCTFDARKQQIIEKVVTNDDVLHQWSFCVPDAEESISNTLLKKVVELFVNIRGFAFASSCVELYKQANKKTLSKKKALRTELNLSDS